MNATSNFRPGTAPGSTPPGGDGGVRENASASAYESGAFERSTLYDDATIGSLLRQLGRELPSLVVKEFALARSELSESLRATKAGMISLIGGAVVATGGLGVLLMAAVYGLSQVVAIWWAALIVGAAATGLGFILLLAGKRQLSPEALRPDRTLDQLRKDTDTVNAHAKGATQ